VREVGKAALARIAISAVDPLVELLLELGVTSPEAESLLRSVFVHKAKAMLAKAAASSGSASDVRIALVTGVHRNFVRRLLAEPPRIAAARAHKGHRTDRLLEAWHVDPIYLDSNGKPRDLPEAGEAPSFASLANKYVPGTPPRVILDELRRSQIVQQLAEHRLRVLSRRFRMRGVNSGNIRELSARAQGLLETLTHNLRQPQEQLVCDSMRPVEIDADRMAAVTDLIARRSANFMNSMAQELSPEAPRSRHAKARKRVTIGLVTFQTARRPAG
jgi:hypothetical protein